MYIQTKQLSSFVLKCAARSSSLRFYHNGVMLLFSQQSECTVTLKKVFRKNFPCHNQSQTEFDWYNGIVNNFYFDSQPIAIALGTWLTLNQNHPINCTRFFLCAGIVLEKWTFSGLFWNCTGTPPDFKIFFRDWQKLESKLLK